MYFASIFKAHDAVAAVHRNDTAFTCMAKLIKQLLHCGSSFERAARPTRSNKLHQPTRTYYTTQLYMNIVVLSPSQCKIPLKFHCLSQKGGISIPNFFVPTLYGAMAESRPGDRHRASAGTQNSPFLPKFARNRVFASGPRWLRKRGGLGGSARLLCFIQKLRRRRLTCPWRHRRHNATVHRFKGTGAPPSALRTSPKNYVVVVSK